MWSLRSRASSCAKRCRTPSSTLPTRSSSSISAGRAARAAARGQIVFAGRPSARSKLLPEGQPDRAARARSAQDGRTRRCGDARMAARTWHRNRPGRPRIVFSSPSEPARTRPICCALVAHGAGLRVRWFAVNVETPATLRLGPADRARIRKISGSPNSSAQRR